MEAWIEDQPDFDEQLRSRLEVLERHPDVVVTDEKSEDAELELAELLLELLPRSLPQHYSRQGDAVVVRPTGETWVMGGHDQPALRKIARVVPDDFCFMCADDDGVYRLRSAVVCFPTRWQLHLKLGRALTPIHEPVPGYDGELGKGVEQVFERLTVERPLWRINWSLVTSPKLYQPLRPSELDEHRLTPESIGELLWFRAERQSIVRLKRSNAVVFAIRIKQSRLDEALSQDAGAATRLLEHLNSMPSALKTYKGLTVLEPTLRSYLGRFES